MNDTYITIVGNVVDVPRLRQTNSGVPVASFRIASTSRRFDRDTGEWADNERLFATVTCWRAMAHNAAQSLKKGQPVVATGRFYSREYVKDEVTRMSYELDAVAVGHDLSRGTAEFTKIVRPYAVTSVEIDDDGMPVDMTGERIDEVVATPALASVG
ncbi:MAG TPA: single-stranded DNA-binding protein [Jatrophihabitantaceae bacterium]|jgi:single-strand DNA-binding protein